MKCPTDSGEDRAGRRERLLPTLAVAYHVMVLDGTCRNVADEAAAAVLLG